MPPIVLQASPEFISPKFIITVKNVRAHEKQTDTNQPTLTTSAAITIVSTFAVIFVIMIILVWFVTSCVLFPIYGHVPIYLSTYIICCLMLWSLSAFAVLRSIAKIWHRWAWRVRSQDAATRDPVTRLSHLEEYLPAQKFSAWREQLSHQGTNSIQFHPDDNWSVPSNLHPVRRLHLFDTDYYSEYLKFLGVWRCFYHSAICLSDILEKDIVRGLPCKHVFHRRCIDHWFRGFHTCCPLCMRIFYNEE